MQALTQIFENNKNWSQNKSQQSPDFFTNLAKGQSPRYLWIGCSDSRVPATQACGLEPGDIFVHRNIANLISPSDLSALSVIEYAVNHLGVKDIIICGHTSCGGVAGAMSQADLGIINSWIQPITNTYTANKTTIDGASTDQDKVNTLCQLNVRQQVENMASLPVIQKAWANQKDLTIHGLIYNLETGLIEDLDCRMSNTQGLPETLKLKLT